MSETAALELSAVTAGYGETMVLDDLSLNLAPGESISVIGRNGVGKTSLMNAVVGQHPTTGGIITWEDDDITTMPPHERARRGIAFVPLAWECLIEL